MAERPKATESVWAENFVHASDSRDASAEWRALDILAAEVMALRETLARVEGLPAKWRREGFWSRDCAEDLEKALKGES